MVSPLSIYFICIARVCELSVLFTDAHLRTLTGPAHAHAAGPVSADVDDNEGDGAMRRPPRCHPRPIT